MAEKYLTKEGLKKLKEELNYLEIVKRKEIAAKLTHAIGFGDLSENAAYDEAKESQGFLEGKIRELKEIIAQAKIIQKSSSVEKAGKVQIGSTVLVSWDSQKEKYQIVGAEEADILAGKISHSSPLGKVLLDRLAGEVVKFESPGGIVEYRIIKVD